MTGSREKDGARSTSGWRNARWAAVAFIWLIPLLAMQFTDEVAWGVPDFAIFGALLVGAALSYEFASKRTGSTAYKIAVSLAILTAFLLFWINGAVGIIGNENNDANLMFYGVLAIGLISVLVTRFEPRGMGRAMSITAGAQVLVFVIALIAGWGDTGETAAITLFFALMWLLSARLFWKAAIEISPTGEGTEA